MRVIRYLLAVSSLAASLAATDKVKADPIQIRPCSFCTSASPKPYLKLSYMVGNNPPASQRVYISGIVYSPISGSDSLSNFGRTSTVNYALDFGAAHLFAYAYEQNPQFLGINTQASVQTTAVDYLYVVGASSGSFISLDTKYDFKGLFDDPYSPGGGNPISYANLLARTLFSVQGATTNCQYMTSIVASAGSGSCSSQAPIVGNGLPIETVREVWAFVNSSNETAMLDALNTVFFTNVQVFDANGNLEPNVQIYSGSGFNYNAAVTPPTSPVPEPASFYLLGTAASMIVSKKLVTRKS